MSNTVALARAGLLFWYNAIYAAIRNRAARTSERLLLERVL